MGVVPTKNSRWIALVVIAIIGVGILGAAIVLGWLLPEKSCDELVAEPGGELTFEMAYCQGDLCSAITEADCRSIDVLKKDFTSGRDGQSDCVWMQGLDVLDACRPNR
ncbi:MAG: hypothetical protein HY341_00775 [Candidatus Kerfeldbacteria bacterium]|nr:hypothetical protein [Candidatus Kerfeldbacteria bacterium]